MDTETELVRRKLLGCRTTTNADWYFLVCSEDHDVFLDQKTQDVKAVYLDGVEVIMGDIIGVSAIAQQMRQYGGAWQILADAIKEYLACQPNL